MKNQFLIIRHDNSFIDNSCLPTVYKLCISVFILALLGAFNFWWFLLPEDDPQLVIDIYTPKPHHHPVLATSNTTSSVSVAVKTKSFCNSRSIETKSCDVFSGKWVPDPNPPPYTNDTCPFIFPNQDCMTNGRPDRDFIHWRWQPHDCDIPAFDPALFLRLMVGKSMLFVGDSLARNQMQSLLCQIAQVETPVDIQKQSWEHRSLEVVWRFRSYNFTLAMAWSTFLVNYTLEEGTWKIHLDRLDETWAFSLHSYDIAVFSTLNWYFRRSIYYVEGKSISEYDPANVTSNIQDLLVTIKRVWSNVLNHLVENYEGIGVVRTVSVAHFEGAAWDKGGACYKTQPDFDPHRNMSLPWTQNEVLKIQKKELKKALQKAENSSSFCRLRLLDVTYSTLLRPDGHPGEYRIQNPTEARNDCSHWCMPGPIDSWNQLLFADPKIMCS